MTKTANGKIRKKVKRRLRWQGVFFFAFLFVGLFFLGRTLLEVNVKSVKVAGSSFVKDSQIIKNAGLNEEVSFLKLNSKKACEMVLEDPLIKSCKIKKNWNFRVDIIVEENTPLFYSLSSNALVLSDGRRLDEANNHGIATLINFVPEDVMSEFIDRLSGIDSDIIHSISEIEYSPTISDKGVYIDKERFIFDMNDGNKVIINNRNMAILNKYKTIYASIDKKGVFEFDCDYDNYIFTEYGD